jgi:hypothetical protein
MKMKVRFVSAIGTVSLLALTISGIAMAEPKGPLPAQLAAKEKGLAKPYAGSFDAKVLAAQKKGDMTWLIARQKLSRDGGGHVLVANGKVEAARDAAQRSLGPAGAMLAKVQWGDRTGGGKGEVTKDLNMRFTVSTQQPPLMLAPLAALGPQQPYRIIVHMDKNGNPTGKVTREH